MPSGRIRPPSEERCVGEAVLAGVGLAQVVPPAVPFLGAGKIPKDFDLLINLLIFIYADAENVLSVFRCFQCVLLIFTKVVRISLC